MYSRSLFTLSLHFCSLYNSFCALQNLQKKFLKKNFSLSSSVRVNTPLLTSDLAMADAFYDENKKYLKEVPKEKTSRFHLQLRSSLHFSPLISPWLIHPTPKTSRE